MKSFRIPVILLGVALAAALALPAVAHASPSTRTVSFKGSYNGTATVLIDNSSVQIQSVKGTGSSSVVGSGSVSGTGNGTGASGQCVPFDGKGTVKGSAGTIKFTVNASKSQGCSSGQSGPVTVTVVGTMKVTSGTGKASGAKGTLGFKGTLKLNDTSGSQTGAFSGKISGKLTISK